VGYCTGAELKDELQAGDDTFTRDDDLFDQLAEEATKAIDAYTFRTFIVPQEPTPRAFRPDRFGTTIYALPDIASTEGLALEYLSGTSTWEPAAPTTWWAEVYEGGVEVEAPGMVKALHGVSFACGEGGRPSVRVTALWGWPATPLPVHRACLLWARRLYVRKDSPAGVLGFGDMGAVRLSSVDPDIRNLLGPYRRKGLLVG
jgi:hypothetical protein